MADSVRIRKEISASASLIGLHICDKCVKENVDVLKKILESCQVDENIENITKDLAEMKMMLEERTRHESMVQKQIDEMKDLKPQLDKLTGEFKQFSDKLNEMSMDKVKETEKWSDLFKNNVQEINRSVKSVQESVFKTKTATEIKEDRELRKNNLVFYNLKESVTDQKSNDKDFLTELLKEFDIEFDHQKDVLQMNRIGKKIEGKDRPMIVKFYNFSLKNMILESCYKLKGLMKFKKLIVSHDLSVEDRENCKNLIEKAKAEKAKTGEADKFVYKIRGAPGSFHVVLVKKQNL